MKEESTTTIKKQIKELSYKYDISEIDRSKLEQSIDLFMKNCLENSYEDERQQGFQEGYEESIIELEKNK